MQKTLIKLFFLQLLLLALLAGIACIFAGKAEIMAVAAGGLMAITATVFAWMVFRRLPGVMSVRMFLGGMMVSEVGKWVIVLLLGSLFIRHHPPLWLLAGFVATYSAYFWIMLFD